MMDFKDEVKDLLILIDAANIKDTRRIIALFLERAFVQGQQAGLAEAQSIARNPLTELEAVK